MNRHNIGARYVLLEVMPYEKYKKFNSAGQEGGEKISSGGGRRETKTLKLGDVVNSVAKNKALALRGLPFRVTLDEIKEFFSEVCAVPDEKIHIEEDNGRRSGAALVEFENEDQAQEVKEALNRKEIGGRFILLFDQNDRMWEQVVQAN